MNKTSSALLAALTLVIGLTGGYFWGAQKPPAPEKTPQVAESMRTMPDGTVMSNTGMTMDTMSMEDMMDGMNAELRGKSGDALDQAFLDEMIVHHEGAVEMAEILLAGTKRPELKKMGDDIIRAQTQEIAQMKSWRTEWFQDGKK